jgi:hypothetical protein
MSEARSPMMSVLAFVKVQAAGNLHRLSTIYGAAQAVPFQNTTLYAA